MMPHTPPQNESEMNCGTPKGGNRVHVIGDVRCHADEMEQKQPDLMKDQRSDEAPQ
jgi:hypothetical protein